MKHISESIIGRKGGSYQSVIIVPIDEDVSYIKSFDPKKTGIILTHSENAWLLAVTTIQNAAKCDLIPNLESRCTRIFITDLSVKSTIDLCKSTHVNILFKSIPPEFKEITKEDCIKIIKTK